MHGVLHHGVRYGKLEQSSVQHPLYYNSEYMEEEDTTCVAKRMKLSRMVEIWNRNSSAIPGADQTYIYK
jgi:hypothetical protein